MGPLLRFLAVQLFRAAYWRSAYLRRLLGAALLFLGGALLLLQWIEGATEREFAGAGSFIIAAAFALPNLARARDRRRPFLSLYAVAGVLVAAGIGRVAGADVPGFGIALIAAGAWFLVALRGVRLSAGAARVRRFPGDPGMRR